MARLLPLLLFSAALACAQQAEPPKEKAQQPPYAEPEEEDASAKPKKEYVFNPLQAETEIKTGKFYMKRGKWKAASMRFEEALLWNGQAAEAYLLLGEAREKMGESAAAKSAYEKYLQVAPDTKEAPEVKKRLGKLPQGTQAKK